MSHWRSKGRNFKSLESNENNIQPIKELAFEKTNKFDNPYRTKRDNSQIKKIRDKTEDVKIDYSEIQRIIRRCFENYILKAKSLKEMDTF